MDNYTDEDLKQLMESIKRSSKDIILYTMNKQSEMNV